MRQLTPAEYVAMLEGYRWREENEAAKIKWLAWHSALLPYVKQVPGLNEFIGNKDTQTWQESKSAMLSMVAEHNREVTKHGHNRGVGSQDRSRREQPAEGAK
jgi:hypothetical protein